MIFNAFQNQCLFIYYGIFVVHKPFILAGTKLLRIFVCNLVKVVDQELDGVLLRGGAGLKSMLFLYLKIALLT